MNPIILLQILAGLTLLIVGAEMLVKGGASFAARMGVSSLVIGLTIVAYGTSSPELVVSIKSAIAGSTDIAIGNVVGSNIFNVLFILGISALICPLKVSQQLIRFDVPVMIGISALTIGLSLDGKLGKLDGLIFLAGIVVYTVYVIRAGKNEKKEVIQEYESEFGHFKKPRSWFLDVALIIGGLGVLVLGARWFVEGAIGIARNLGVSELVIALTIVAAGTSMPEVATSIMASIRKERDIAVGNVIGSNIYNILAILGVASLLAKGGGLPVSTGMLDFDMPVMLAVAIACLPLFFTGHLISRWEGAAFVFYYAAYTGYLILKSSEHDQLPVMSSVMWYFVLPITLLTMAIFLFRSISKKGD